MNRFEQPCPGGTEATDTSGDQAPPPNTANDPVGLCRICHHARRTGNRRGTVFYLCGLAQTDDRWPRYPHLPVQTCSGYLVISDCS